MKSYDFLTGHYWLAILKRLHSEIAWVSSLSLLMSTLIATILNIPDGDNMLEIELYSEYLHEDVSWQGLIKHSKT